MTTNRRQFSRINFQTEARLFVADGEYPVEVDDLSLKGALIRPEKPLTLHHGSPCSLIVRLDEMGTTIRMEASIAHHAEGVYGLACRGIDLDSVTHLRRLVELNLGDTESLERELSLLVREDALPG